MFLSKSFVNGGKIIMNCKDYLEYIKLIRPSFHIHAEHRGSEENVKIKIIIPLLQSLGWDVLNDMRFEILGADIVIYNEGKSIIIVETKSWDDIIDNHLNQCLEYCLKHKTPWIIISTGQDTAIYCAWINPDNLALAKPVLEFSLAKLQGNDGEGIMEKLSLLFGKDNYLNNNSALNNIVAQSFDKEGLEYAKKRFEEKAAGYKSKIKSARLTDDAYLIHAEKHTDDIRGALLFLREEIEKLLKLNDNISVRYRSKEIGIDYFLKTALRKKKVGLFGVYPIDGHIAFSFDGWEKLGASEVTLLKFKQFPRKVESKKWAEEVINLLRTAIREIKH